MHKNLCIAGTLMGGQFVSSAPAGRRPSIRLVLKKIAFLLARDHFCGYTGLRPTTQAFDCFTLDRIVSVPVGFLLKPQSRRGRDAGGAAGDPGTRATEQARRG